MVEDNDAISGGAEEVLDWLDAEAAGWETSDPYVSENCASAARLVRGYISALGWIAAHRPGEFWDTDDEGHTTGASSDCSRCEELIQIARDALNPAPDDLKELEALGAISFANERGDTP